MLYSFLSVFFVFFLSFAQIKVQALDTVPSSFDWRNVHGRDLISPLKNNPNKNGCFADASIGLMESSINLYYNRQLNLDLSEQAGRDCYYDTDNTIPALTNRYLPDPNCPVEDGSNGSIFARKALNVGFFDEACDPFRPVSVNYNSCSNTYICSN